MSRFQSILGAILCGAIVMLLVLVPRATMAQEPGVAVSAAASASIDTDTFLYLPAAAR